MAKMEYDSEEYLKWRSEKNRKVKTLTPKQHDALELIAKARHEMHKDQKAFILSDSPKHSQFEHYIGPHGKGSLNRTLQNAGLPVINFPKDIYKVLVKDAVKRDDFASDYEYQIALAKHLDKDKQLTEQLNSVIEAYLRKIDAVHHTRYCPSGKHRVHDNTNHTEKVIGKIERQTAMMDVGGKAFQGLSDVKTKPSDSYAKKPEGARQRLFVDMDGTLAVFDAVNSLEELYEPGYFKNLNPQTNVVDAIRDIISNHSEDIEVFVISSVISGARTALAEKNEWLDKYMPELDEKHRVFCKSGIDRTTAIPGGLRKDDFLLDDYTRNLQQWEPPARAVKLLNGINHTKSSWQGDRLRYDRDFYDITDRIIGMMKGNEHVRDTNQELAGKVSKKIEKTEKQIQNAKKIYGFDSLHGQER